MSSPSITLACPQEKNKKHKLTADTELNERTGRVLVTLTLSHEEGMIDPIVRGRILHWGILEALWDRIFEVCTCISVFPLTNEGTTERDSSALCSVYIYYKEGDGSDGIHHVSGTRVTPFHGLIRS